MWVLFLVPAFLPPVLISTSSAQPGIQGGCRVTHADLKELPANGSGGENVHNLETDLGLNPHLANTLSFSISEMGLMTPALAAGCEDGMRSGQCWVQRLALVGCGFTSCHGAQDRKRGPVDHCSMRGEKLASAQCLPCTSHQAFW